ncbi:RRF domain-containing protein [Rhizoctonia solani AG-1 IA]|uniref:RRF domain-containing protein n=1 Tax=Thanatephorus cucumeris (strain AG1-IA) TaxID=983506 RepID=L8X6V0_THACA|nr:RRF domain-containing protein [Rhizoctonia solani AG-1 IA]
MWSRSLLRLAFRPRVIIAPRPRALPSITTSACNYAKGHRKTSLASTPTPEAVETHTDFTPPKGSKGHKREHEDISPVAASDEDEIINQASKKMDSTIDWFKRELAQMEARVSGRVVPSLLDPVRVKLKDAGGAAVKLDQVSTVGVRDGNVLVITLFDEANMKDVESSIINAQIPNMNPQRADARTLRIVVPKPTMEARQAVVTNASRMAEDTKVKIRTSRESGMKDLKKMGHAKHSKFADEVRITLLCSFNPD